ncbi:putative SH3 domain protein [Trypanosoma cruzi]|nr:putative SH3 domain protein [Trypanosoma cruzi]
MRPTPLRGHSGLYTQRAQRNRKNILAAQTAVKKRQRGRPLLMKTDGGSPIHSTASQHFAQTSHRAADTLPDILNCPTQSSRRATELIRQRRSTVVRRITEIHASGRLYEESERGGLRNVSAANVGRRMPLAGQFSTFCRTHEQPINGESRAAFLESILDVAPSTRPRHTRMLRSMSEMNRTLPDMMILGLQKIAARSETKQARPSTEEEMNQLIRIRADWRERAVF